MVTRPGATGAAFGVGVRRATRRRRGCETAGTARSREVSSRETALARSFARCRSSAYLLSSVLRRGACSTPRCEFLLGSRVFAWTRAISSGFRVNENGGTPAGRSRSRIAPGRASGSRPATPKAVPPCDVVG